VYIQNLLSVVFAVLKHSNALFEMMACSEILLELCPAEATVFCFAGTIRNFNCELYFVSGFLSRAPPPPRPFHPNAHTLFLSCRNGNRKVRFKKDNGVVEKCLYRRKGISHYK
jgi:hypothetical protein